MKMFKPRSLLLAVLTVLVFGLHNVVFASEPSVKWRDDTRSERMAWWKEAKFGMFIHWGIHSMFAGKYKGAESPRYSENIMAVCRIPVAEYKAMAKGFYPDQYDPEAWVLLAKEAGMKYIVLTAKHSEGFALWDSKVCDWNVTDATRWGKDLIEPLADACKKHGIKLGFYYCQAMDCMNGGRPNPHYDKKDGPKISIDEYIRTIAVPQVKELMTNYGEIAVIWWDVPGNTIKADHAQLLIEQLDSQPNILMNDRLISRSIAKGFIGDFNTPENSIPKSLKADRAWEACQTMNYNWGYRASDTDWKSPKTLLKNLATCVSNGGNYLLNVGPKPDGTFPQPNIQALKEMGQWMKINSESIYGCGPTVFKQYAWQGVCTTRKNMKGTLLYLHVFDWPKEGLVVPGVKNKIETVYLLADPAKKALPYKQHEYGQIIDLPANAPTALSSVVVVQLKGAADIDHTIELPALAASGVYTLVPKHAERTREAGFSDAIVRLCMEQKATSAQWELDLDESGVYTLKADYACNRDKTFSIHTKAYELPVLVTKSGTWNLEKEERKLNSHWAEKFWKKGVSVGAIYLEKGKQTVRLRASKTGATSPNERLYLRHIRLAKVDLTHAGSAPIKLDSSTALLHGTDLMNGNIGISQWHQGDRAEWTVRLTDYEGVFDVNICVASPVACSIELGSKGNPLKKLAVAASEGSGTQRIGQIDLPNTGLHTITCKGVANSKDLHLKYLVLTPVDSQ